MSNVTHIIKCSDSFAIECKLEFKDNYVMYVDYLSSLRTLSSGESCHIIPLSEKKYLELDVSE